MKKAIVVMAALGVSVTYGARVDDPSDPKDLHAIQACLKAKGEANRDRESCIEVVAKPCIGPDEAAKAPSELIECLGREQLVWDQMLNQAFRKLRDGLDDKQRVRLRDMQRSWLDTRDRTCAFYYDYFKGTMANPMMASCTNRETARRAIFLIGFADDMAGWAKNKR